MKTAHLTPEQAEAVRVQLAKGVPAERIVLPREPKASKSDIYRSKTERQYAWLLEDRKKAGEIRDWRYEEMRLLIARGSVDGKRKAAHYKVDFLVWENDGTLTCVEIKGFEREAGILRIKAAAERYPFFRFVLVKRQGGAWTEERI